MTPLEVRSFQNQVVEMEFADGERVRARVVSVDPDQLDNHVVYEVVEVLQVGRNSRRPRPGAFLAANAAAVTALRGLPPQ